MERGCGAGFSPAVRLNLVGGSAGWFARRLFFLAALETVAVLGFAASLLTGEFLPGKARPLLKLTLVFSLFIFSVLAFGSRLTAKFDVAAINLLYFLGALLCFREVERAETLGRPL